MAEQGSMIVNGKKVDGRTLSFGEEGVKVGNGEEEKVVVPNEFNFAEEAEVTESDFADFADVNNESYVGHNSLLYDLNRKEINKKVMIGAGIAVGVVAGLIIGGVIYKKKG